MFADRLPAAVLCLPFRPMVAALLTAAGLAVVSPQTFSKEAPAPIPGAAGKKEETSHPPEAARFSYETKAIEGWTVKIDRRLLEDPERKLLTEKTLELLVPQLQGIVAAVPAPAVKHLRKVTLWISPEYPGTVPKAEYHPGAGWLRDNHRNPAMAGGVEINNTSIFEAELQRMPVLMLHELAHAYHHQVLGFEHAEIQRLHRKAVLGGSYAAVERTFGNPARPNTVERAYALSSPQEYFAEGTEAYFGRNDFFPFTRGDLKAHDPALFELLEKIWNAP